ncbi:hypothetical protein PoB_003666400 [Plakobranchus ocellatus]|uniref:Uncharacterized protein n=1 Tax=Plakobranchus ocellatus TaxID=259542 RepID=A0AAV4AQS6_9GAST|nr:hypothetical protein PoB_003666400 [Plakobranchus ocellatus]
MGVDIILEIQATGPPLIYCKITCHQSSIWFDLDGNAKEENSLRYQTPHSHEKKILQKKKSSLSRPLAVSSVCHFNELLLPYVARGHLSGSARVSMATPIKPRHAPGCQDYEADTTGLCSVDHCRGSHAYSAMEGF